MTVLRCPVQRRKAVFVFAENQIRIILEQRSYLIQVALRSRVMNLAAEGETAPSQREQRDGDETGNQGAIESAKD
jgi:hypothetical protein